MKIHALLTRNTRTRTLPDWMTMDMKKDSGLRSSGSEE